MMIDDDWWLMMIDDDDDDDDDDDETWKWDISKNMVVWSFFFVERIWWIFQAWDWLPDGQPTMVFFF